ncbi:hypothetical protein ABZ595_35185 [Streptomyces rubradiris]|uniref:hypothetical protein n=1 Tax=Streptomyces rubradiris TaxID=285531 RepID=UPI0033C2273F
MRNLREGLPEQGWKIVEYGPDSSAEKNLTLIADNAERKAGVPSRSPRVRFLDTARVIPSRRGIRGGGKQRVYPSQSVAMRPPVRFSSPNGLNFCCSGGS